MRYANANDIFPKNVLALIQEYTDGEYIYIPKKAERRKSWGDNTNSKTEIRQRNIEIFKKYKTGRKTAELACEYFLSEKSIQRIVTLGRKA